MQKTVLIKNYGQNTRLENTIRENFDSFSKSFMKVAVFLLSNQDKIPFVSARKLASEIGVSESTVLRFIHFIGYKGYPDLQQDLQKWLTKRIKPSRKLEQIAQSKKIKDIHKLTLASDIRRLISLRKSLSSEQLNMLYKAISSARKKYIFGERTSFAMAYLFSFFLSQLFDEVYLLKMDDPHFIRTIAEANGEDMALAISFPRFAKRTVDISLQLMENNCRVIAITSSLISPLGRIAHDVIELDTGSDSYFNSFATVVSFLNCLIQFISIEKADQATPALRKQEKIVESFDMLHM